MVNLTVVDDDVVDLLEVDFLLEVFYELKLMGCSNGIDQNGFALLNQIGILAGAVENGVFISMEFLQFPINVAHLANIDFHLLFQCLVLTTDCRYRAGVDCTLHIALVFLGCRLIGFGLSIVIHAKYCVAHAAAKTAANAGILIYKCFHIKNSLS